MLGLGFLQQLYVIGGKHPKTPVKAVPPPPAFVNHLYACDDFIRIEGDLRVVGCGWETESSGQAGGITICHMSQAEAVN